MTNNNNNNNHSNNKRKGDVYGRSSPISPPSASTFRYKDAISVLNLLPAAILALAAALSTDDREVLAYMITRSFLYTAAADPKKLRCRSKRVGLGVTEKEKSPLFDCSCFDCYTAYWLRWDSSPDRELIHRVIEAFEDHLATGQREARASAGRRQRLVSSVADTDTRTKNSPDRTIREGKEDAIPTHSGVTGGPESEVPVKEMEVAVEAAPAAAVPPSMVSPPDSGHRGLARKMLPDVVGLLNSRLWRLWNPNV